MIAPRRARFAARVVACARLAGALASATVVHLASQPAAHADAAASDADRATARALGQEGEDALEKKDFTLAEDRFRRADALYHAPTLALGLARAQAGLGRLVNAEETYRRIVREGVGAAAPAPFVRAVEQAKSEVAALSPRVGSVVLQVTGPEAPIVRIDDVPVPSAALGVRRPIDPGMHKVEASAEGWTPLETSFTVAEGEQLVFPVSLTLATPATVGGPALGTSGGHAASPPREATSSSTSSSTYARPATPDAGKPRRVTGYVTLAAGGAFVVAGGVLGIAALARHSSLSSRCPNDTCPAELRGDVSRFHTLGMLSTLGFVVGGVAAATGAVLVFTAPSRDGAAPSSTAAAATVNTLTTAFTIGPDLALSHGGALVGASGRF